MPRCQTSTCELVPWILSSYQDLTGGKKISRFAASTDVNRKSKIRSTLPPVLAVGQYNCEMVFHLREAGLNAKGVEVFPIDMVDNVAPHCQEMMARGDVVRHELEKLPFKDSQFSLAIAAFVLERQPVQAVHKVLYELARVAAHVMVVIAQFEGDPADTTRYPPLQVPLPPITLKPRSWWEERLEEVGLRADPKRTEAYAEVKQQWEADHALHRFQSGGAIHAWKKVKKSRKNLSHTLQPGDHPVDEATGRKRGATEATREHDSSALYARYHGINRFQEGELDHEERRLHLHSRPNLHKDRKQRAHMEEKGAVHGHQAMLPGFHAADWSRHRATAHTADLQKYGAHVAEINEVLKGMDINLQQADTSRLQYNLANLKALIQDQENLQNVAAEEMQSKKKSLKANPKLAGRLRGKIMQYGRKVEALQKHQVAIENELMHREAEVDMHSDAQVQEYRERQAQLARSHAQQSTEEASRWEQHRQRVQAARKRQHHNAPHHVQLFPNHHHG